MAIIDHALSAEAKVKRAEKHIRDLKAECDVFLKRNPYRRVAQENPETGERVTVFRVVETAPDQISLVLGDAIHNLRSSLDHLACQFIFPSNSASNFFLL